MDAGPAIALSIGIAMVYGMMVAAIAAAIYVASREERSEGGGHH